MMNKRQAPLSPQRALNRAAALCARSEQAATDIRKKLAAWGVPSRDAEAVITQLVEQGYLDEGRYARAFVNDRFNFNGWGRIKIAFQLRNKGIAAQHIDEALASIDGDAYRERLAQALRAKWQEVKGREPRQAWAAMMRHAQSRGYEPDLASKCISQIMGGNVQDD